MITIYKFIKYLILNIKYTGVLKQICVQENLINNLSALFKTKFRMDWVGRIYAVFNPNLLDINDQIFEYVSADKLDNSLYIEKWIMQNLNIANEFIKNNALFDMLTYSITKIDDYDNYLFVIKVITFDDFIKYFKRFIYIIISILILTITTIIILK